MIESKRKSGIEKRAQIFQKGKAKFVKRHGILFFGVPMTVVFIISNFFVILPGFEFSISTLPKLLTVVVIAAFGGLASGYFFGLFMWYFYIKPANRLS